MDLSNLTTPLLNLVTETLVTVRDDLAERFSVECTDVVFEFRSMGSTEPQWKVVVDKAALSDVFGPTMIIGYGKSLPEAIDDLKRDIHVKTMRGAR